MDKMYRVVFADYHRRKTHYDVKAPNRTQAKKMFVKMWRVPLKIFKIEELSYEEGRM